MAKDKRLHYICTMNAPEILENIKLTVNSFLPGSQVLLFGSRARGQEHADSDYDLLVVTTDTFGPREKMSWENKIRKALITAFGLPFDIIVQSQGEVQEKKSITGHIVYYAVREAVEL